MEAAIERIVRKVLTEELGVFRTGLLREIESMLDQKMQTPLGPVGSPWVPQAHGYYGSQPSSATAVPTQSGQKRTTKSQAASEDHPAGPDAAVSVVFQLLSYTTLRVAGPTSIC